MKRKIFINLTLFATFLLLMGSYSFIAYKLNYLHDTHSIAIYHQALGLLRDYYGYKFNYNLFLMSLIPLMGIIELLIIVGRHYKYKDALNNDDHLRYDYNRFVLFQVIMILIFIFDLYPLLIFIISTDETFIVFITFYLLVFHRVLPKLGNLRYNNALAVLQNKHVARSDQYQKYSNIRTTLVTTMIITILMYAFTGYEAYKNNNYWTYPDKLIVNQDTSFDRYYVITGTVFEEPWVSEGGTKGLYNVEVLKRYELTDITVQVSLDSYNEYIGSKDYYLFVSYYENDQLLNPKDYITNNYDPVTFTIPYTKDDSFTVKDDFQIFEFGYLQDEPRKYIVGVSDDIELKFVLKKGEKQMIQFKNLFS